MFVVADILSSKIIICGPRDSNNIYGDSCIQYVVFCLYSVAPVYVWLHRSYGNIMSTLYDHCVSSQSQILLTWQWILLWQNMLLLW